MSSGSYRHPNDAVCSGKVAKGDKGSMKELYDQIEKLAQERLKMKKMYDEIELNRQMAQKPLEEPGWLLKIDLEYPSIEAPRENISRTIRVPTNITFHHLNGILEIVLGFKSHQGYVFSLWDISYENLFAKGRRAKETLVENIEERDIHDWGEHDDEYGSNWSKAKARTLAQVFGGKGRIWKDLPYKIEYEMEVGDTWEYVIEFLGTTEETLSRRPGQEAFCIEGIGYPQSIDFRARGGANELDPSQTSYDKDFINDCLERAWCSHWRMKDVRKATRDVSSHGV